MGMTKATLGGKLLHPSEYLAAVEFGGQDVTLTIKDVQFAELIRDGGAKETKPVLLFVERPRKLVLNKTNASTIAEMYGTKAELWKGKKITMYPGRWRSDGDCIRVRAGEVNAEQ